jgi:uncharacterized protein with PIN domain
MSASEPSPLRRIDNPRPTGSYRKGPKRRVLLDEMLAPDIAKALVALGIDAVRSTPGTGDGAVTQRCLDESRLLVTKNHDLVFRATNAGVICVYLRFRKGTDSGYVGQVMRVFSQLEAWLQLQQDHPGCAVRSRGTFCEAVTQEDIIRESRRLSVRREP